MSFGWGSQCFSNNPTSYYNPHDDPSALQHNRERFAYCRSEYYGVLTGLFVLVFGIVCVAVYAMHTYRPGGLAQRHDWWLKLGVGTVGVLAAAIGAYALAGMSARSLAKMRFDQVVARWNVQKSVYDNNYAKFVRHLTRENQVRAINRTGTALLANAF